MNTCASVLYIRACVTERVDERVYGVACIVAAYVCTQLQENSEWNERGMHIHVFSLRTHIRCNVLQTSQRKPLDVRKIVMDSESRER